MSSVDSAQLILGSQSPRRRELLARLGVRFNVISADIDESPLPDESAEHCVRRLAEAKASLNAKLDAERHLYDVADSPNYEPVRILQS